MELANPNYLFLALLIIMPIAFFLHAKRVKELNPGDRYFQLEGRKLKFRSATLNGNNYAFCIEYLVSDQYLGIRCYFPPFNLIVKYEDIQLSKSRALIGSLVCMEIPNYEGKIEITHKLAKKLDHLSKGRLGYASV